MNDTNRKRILIVDDEANMRRTLKRILSKDYIVLEADSGRQAVTMAQEERPDIVLMDIMMPEIDGLTACLQIKNNPFTKWLPVIILTAVDFELNKKYSQECAKADAYITKPFEPDDLLRSIRQLIGSPVASKTTEI